MTSEQLLSQVFVNAHPVDAARMLEQLPVEETVPFLTEIPPDSAAKVTKLMAPLTAASCLECMDAGVAAPIIAKLPIEIVAILLRRVEESKRLAILKMLPTTIVESFGLVLNYPENTAGALMNPQVFTLTDDITVREAVKLIRRQPRHVFYHIPVINRQYMLMGLVNIRELMLAQPEESISAVMHTGSGQLSPTSSRDAILAHPDWRMYHDLPVADEKGIFLGVIDYRTIRRLESESQESGLPGAAHDAGKALGELYWIGMSAFFKGAAAVVNPDKKPDK